MQLEYKIFVFAYMLDFVTLLFFLQYYLLIFCCGTKYIRLKLLSLANLSRDDTTTSGNSFRIFIYGRLPLGKRILAITVDTVFAAHVAYVCQDSGQHLSNLPDGGYATYRDI
jgi:hypothetical protein